MPDWKAEIRARLRDSRLDGAVEGELVEELASHAADRYSELLKTGLEKPQARARVLEEMSSLDGAVKATAHRLPPREVSPPAAGANPITDFVRDVRYGFRAMRRTPLHAFFAVLALAIGIGANVTVFTVVNTIILHPLPVHDVSKLMAVFKVQTGNARASAAHLPISWLDFRDYERAQAPFVSLAASTSPSVLSLRTPGGEMRAFGEFVSGRYFETLGLRPALGRFFAPAEVSERGSAPVAVASYNFWQGHFQGENPVGRTVILNGSPFTIVGVAPKGFLGISPIFGPDFWIPATMAEATLPAQMGRALTDRAQAAFQVWGRLRPGVSRSAANAAMDALGQVISKQYAAPDDTTRVTVRPLSEELYASPVESGYVLGSAVLMAIVGLVLAIACANVANLQLARGVARYGEIAVRLAMGANRGRLIRQMLTESLLLSLIGCLAGGALGYAGCRFIWSFFPPEVAQNMIAPKLDSTVLVFTLCASVITALVFGIAPAMRAAGIEVSIGLRQAGRSGSRTRRSRFFTRALLAGQVAFSLICLATAALVLRSVERAYATNPGFDTHHLALFMMNPEQTGYDSPRLKTFYRAMRERLSAEPGIAGASWASNLPFWNRASQSVKISGTDMQKKEQFIPAVTATVDLNYFSVLGIPLVRGRVFGPEDRDGARPVAVINAQLAREHWPGGDALGQELELTGEQRPREVVGIVQTANYTSLGEAPQPAVYVPLDQKFGGAMTLYVRAKGGGASVMDVVEREIRKYDASIAVTDVRSGDKLIDQALFGPKIGVRLLGAFGLLALALASAGLYGVMAYSVSQRRQEMGVRVAVGASAPKIIANVLREGFVPVSWGVALGSVCCVLLGRTLSHLLFGIGSFDFMSLAAGIVCLVSVAFVACYLPARAAARVDPTCALRDV